MSVATLISNSSVNVNINQEIQSFEDLGPILTMFVPIFFSATAVSFLVNAFLASVLCVGGSRYFLKTRKNVPTGIKELIGNFNDGNYKNIVVTYIMKHIYIALYSLLLFIPGIIKSYEYLLTDKILAVRPDLDTKSVLNLSKAMMRGHKSDAFLLDLSFIPWTFLSGCTRNILGIVYVFPYIEATKVEFYCYVREEALKSGIITINDLPDYEEPQPTFTEPQSSNGFNQAVNFNQSDAQNNFNSQQNAAVYNNGETNQPIGNVNDLPIEETNSPITEVSFTPVSESEAENTSDDAEDF